MKKFFITALCAMIGFGLYAEEEVFDIVYKASSMKMPAEFGFTVAGYQSQNANAAQFASLAPNEDGDTVLLLNHQSKKSEWPNFKISKDQDFKNLTVDVTYRLADAETEDAQFSISVILKDNKRAANRLGFVNISSKDIVSTNGKVAFASGNDVQSLRLVFDGEANAMEVYDLKTKKYLGKKWMANASAKSKVNTLSFGDGSSAVHGIAEVYELKVAFDKKYKPAAQ